MKLPVIRNTPAPLRVFPLLLREGGGRSLWPGKAGSTAALDRIPSVKD